MRIGDRVRVREGGPHDNIGKIGTIREEKFGGFLLKFDDADGLLIYRENELVPVIERQWPIALTQREIETILSWASVAEGEGCWDKVTDELVVTRLEEFAETVDDLVYREREPSDDEIYNRPGVEGGIGYTDDEPGSLGENDWRL